MNVLVHDRRTLEIWYALQNRSSLQKMVEDTATAVIWTPGWMKAAATFLGVTWKALRATFKQTQRQSSTGSTTASERNRYTGAASPGLGLG